MCLVNPCSCPTSAAFSMGMWQVRKFLVWTSCDNFISSVLPTSQIACIWAYFLPHYEQKRCKKQSLQGLQKTVPVRVLIETFSSRLLVQLVVSAPHFANVRILLLTWHRLPAPEARWHPQGQYEMNSLLPRLLPAISLETIHRFPPVVYFLP
jgi:hypothetical protein